MDIKKSTLIKLGLSLVQTKAYLTLTSAEALTIRELSNLSGIPRTDLYRITKELIEKNLVEKIIAFPIKYKAIEINEVLEYLYKKEESKLNQLKNNIKKIKESNNKIELEKNNRIYSQFVEIPPNRVLRRFETIIEKTENSIKWKVCSQRFLKGFDIYFKFIKKACEEKQINWQIIIQKNIFHHKTLRGLINLCKKNSSIEIRLKESPIRVAFSICDEKEAFIVEEPNLHPLESNILWTNNQGIIIVLEEYFKVSWNLAKPIFFD